MEFEIGDLVNISDRQSRIIGAISGATHEVVGMYKTSIILLGFEEHLIPMSDVWEPVSVYEEEPEGYDGYDEYVGYNDTYEDGYDLSNPGEWYVEEGYEYDNGYSLTNWIVEIMNDLVDDIKFEMKPIDSKSNNKQLTQTEEYEKFISKLSA